MSDWLDFADMEAVRGEFEAGPQDLSPMGSNLWGIPGVAVVCAGDKDHMRKIQAKLFSDRFHAQPCPRGHYTADQLKKWKTVAERLAT